MNKKAFLIIFSSSLYSYNPFILLFQSVFRGDFMFDLIQGLELVESIKTDEDGNVYIFYTITDEFMLQNNLHYKHRVFELDLYNSNQPTFLSYAIAVEPDDEEN